jgi:site-specific DNA-adenine methylase
MVDWLVPLMKPFLDKASFYYEPFMGGLNLLCQVDHPVRIGSDINPYLVALFQKVQEDASCIPDTITEDEYKRVAANPAAFPKWLVGLVAFCATYRGLYWGGYARDPGGNRPRQLLNNLRSQAPLIRGIKLFCADYRRVRIEGLPEGGLILCDIPYRGTSGYGFHFDHDGFYRWCGKAAGMGHTVLLTEFWAPSVFECAGSFERYDFLHAQFEGDEVPKVVEKLFVYRG